MAFEKPLFNHALGDAGADLSAKQYHACKLAGGVVVLAGDGEVGYPQQGKSSSVQPAADGRTHEVVTTVMLHGISKVVAGAAFAEFADLAVDANGKYITAVAGKRVVARSLAAATADLEVVEAFILASAYIKA